MTAGLNGNWQLVKILVNQGHADMTKKNLDGDSILYLAAQSGRLSTVKFLARKAPMLIDEPTVDGSTPLWIACLRHNVKVVDYLLKRGANVECKGGSDQSTPLINASRVKALSIVKLLVEKYHADVNAVDKYGRTAFYYAAVIDYVPIMDYLHKNGADVNKTDKRGRSPLYIACAKGNKTAVKFLVRNNVKLASNNPAIIKAIEVCQRKRLDLVKILAEERNIILKLAKKYLMKKQS